MLWRVVRACMWLGIPYIAGFAVGGRRYQTPAAGERLAGYYAWPRLGFDAPITPDDAQFFGHLPYHPEGLATVQQLSGLLDKEGGPAFWKMNGTHRDVGFEVAAGSKNVQILRKYLIDKGFLRP
ncbi:hypothetical protein [Paraburkholderia caribensis]|uniref:hypothetical protein n=1 Tax=Paraburkholderia caribensis TaxID=75105 RepID=UPI00072268DE|nr:hypothetical protein [Paraburkholderia caribensis]ALP68587.1 hypothetical protein AN416_38385 [Paraburkholderia caribensis]AUT57946.1 hypothetical protein C2L66_39390 [Paraburkholderia caribensis]